ncbi:MAG: hypothetical protein ACJAXY_000322 [Nonlabens sp.]|jgi:hypothetical protein
MEKMIQDLKLKVRFLKHLEKAKTNSIPST